MERIELQYQEKITTLGGMETYKYSGKLDADTINMRRWKKNIKKN